MSSQPLPFSRSLDSPSYLFSLCEYLSSSLFACQSCLNSSPLASICRPIVFFRSNRDLSDLFRASNPSAGIPRRELEPANDPLARDATASPPLRRFRLNCDLAFSQIKSPLSNTLYGHARLVDRRQGRRRSHSAADSRQALGMSRMQPGLYLFVFCLFFNWTIKSSPQFSRPFCRLHFNSYLDMAATDQLVAVSAQI